MVGAPGGPALGRLRAGRWLPLPHGARPRRPRLPGYDQDLWAERLAYKDSDLATALDDFEFHRRLDLRVLRRATPEDLQRCVMRHAERGDEPLGHMIKLYAGHNVVRLQQIARIRQAIGAST